MTTLSPKTPLSAITPQNAWAAAEYLQSYCYNLAHRRPLSRREHEENIGYWHQELTEFGALRAGNALKIFPQPTIDLYMAAQRECRARNYDKTACIRFSPWSLALDAKSLIPYTTN